MDLLSDAGLRAGVVAMSPRQAFGGKVVVVGVGSLSVLGLSMCGQSATQVKRFVLPAEIVY